MELLEISIDLYFRPRYGPEVDSAFSRNEYQEYFLGVKVAGAYHLHVATVWKSRTLNFLEPQGPFQACIRIPIT